MTFAQILLWRGAKISDRLTKICGLFSCAPIGIVGLAVPEYRAMKRRTANRNCKIMFII